MEFRKAELKDKEMIDTYFRTYPHKFSKYNFSTIFCWKDAWNFEFAIYKDHLIIKNDFQRFEPVGANPVEIMKELGGHFDKVSEETALKLDGKKAPEQFDYVYPTIQLATLPGSDFEAKRGFVNRFEKYNPKVCLLDNYTKPEFEDLQKEWIKDRAHIEGLAKEHLAVVAALENFKELGLHGVCVRVDNKVVGFALGEKIGDTFYEHFEKGDTNFKGIYQYVLKKLAENVSATYINRGQDLGIEGIRKAKKSYKPVMLEKYTVDL